MNPNPKNLGIMRPLGGGDPIPLKKDELLIGRRKTCDIHLDFENISGRHCQLRMVKGVWHIRDLGSTNGTSVNGHRISSEHGLMPDDELGISGHLFCIDYDPIAPTSLLDANAMLEEEIAATENPHQRSLMELAGLEGEDRLSRRARTQRLAAATPNPPDDAAPPRRERPTPAEPARMPDPIVADDFDAAIPDVFQAPKADLTDEDFFRMIEDDVVKDAKPRRRP